MTPGDNCNDPFTVPHEDAPGQPGFGHDVMTMNFNDFGPGESITFAVDIDATSIQGVVGSGGAGSVSGLELTGSLVTVTFEDGATQTSAFGQIFGDGSAGGGAAVIDGTTAVLAPPTIEMLGVATVPTVFTNGSVVGSVPAAGTQTVRVSGTDGDVVTLLQMTGDFVTDPAFDVDDFESDTAVAVDYQTGTVSGGFVDFVVDVADSDVLYHYTAIAGDGSAGASTQLVVGVGLDVVTDPTTVLYRVNAGGPEVADPNGGPAWTEDQVATGGQAGGTAAIGNPSQYLTAGSNTAFGVAGAVDLSHPSVPAGTPEALFQLERYDTGAATPLVYEFPVGAGQGYELDLYFSETFATAAGVRVFTVNVEGTDFLIDYDIFDQVGGFAGIVETIATPIVADDFLTVTFSHGVQNPKVNAIEVRTVGSQPVDVPPVVDAIDDASTSVGASLAVPVTTTETDGDVVTLSYTSTPDASSFTTFVDNSDGTGTLTFDPVAGDSAVYTVVVTATDKDGSDSEAFNLEVFDPVATVYARINAGGPLVASLDAGPDWEQDNNASPSAFLADGGSNGNSGGAAVEPNASVPAYVPGAVVDTERWSNSGFSYDIPVPAGTQVFVRLFLGNNFAGTSQVGQRVFDIAVDGVLVEDDLDLVAEYGNQLAGMREYLITSDGVVDINFSNVVENPLVNAIEVASASSSPGTLGVAPTAVDFGPTLINGTGTATVTLSNLGFDVGDPRSTWRRSWRRVESSPPTSAVRSPSARAARRRSPPSSLRRRWASRPER